MKPLQCLNAIKSVWRYAAALLRMGPYLTSEILREQSILHSILVRPYCSGSYNGQRSEKDCEADDRLRAKCGA
jgi:hypothetical protein